ncbi:MAG TPA: hypothetical protein VMT35_07680 [Ignavibacteriaceae bacterium]|nr:hypothetical protein [Ignavibacteriaceae bacterium]
MTDFRQRKVNKFPLYGWFGIFLVILFWTLNWSLSGLRTHWGFFPLWLGYCLTIDSLVFIRKGTSMLRRNLFIYILLFFISVPVWWLFEFFNGITRNWIYIGSSSFSDTEYYLLASLSFSTVMPSVLETAEFAGTFKWIKNSKPGLKIGTDLIILSILFISGFIMLLLLVIFPEIFYPLLWLSLYLIIDSINAAAGNNSLLLFTAKGDWRIIFSLFTGCLICAFFWEMWNFYSYPKWIYRLPGVNVLKIFEMPLPGYIGYFPFSLELFALYNFITGWLKKESFRSFVQI